MGVELRTSAIERELEQDKGYLKALEDIERLFLSTSEPWLPHVLENFIEDKKKQLAEYKDDEVKEDG